MTQKELLYVEDAIEHEKNIANIFNNLINNLNDEDIIDFMNDEISKHTSIKEKLLNMLKEKNNE